MALPTKIQHPLLRRPGSSQRKRVDNAFALGPEYAPIDGRSLVDMLYYIHEYARQVVFHAHKKNEEQGAYVELSNWLGFFEKSLPFGLARFCKIDIEQRETEFLKITESIAEEPSAENLQLLIDFGYNELIVPIRDLQRLTDEHDFEFAGSVENAIRASMLPPLMRYILLSNAAGKYFCARKRNYLEFASKPWEIPIEDLFAINDEEVKQIPGGQRGAILWLTNEFREVYYQLLQIFRILIREVPDQIEASLKVLDGEHEPHHGLLFAFLRLFRYFQGDLNKLTHQHLDFFYKKVLRIEPKDLIPDKAHLIFEIAKHLESYPIEKGRAFKDGKDANNADILFKLDDEIVIDKAKVSSLKTLYLNQSRGRIAGSNTTSFVEGLYVAPVANSADGKGEAFQEGQSTNWATLGAQPSKYTTPGKERPENHPYGRVGFVLASPVLWMNEGTRDITITITCNDGGNKDVFVECFREYQQYVDAPLYNLTGKNLEEREQFFSRKAIGFLRGKLNKQDPFFTSDLNGLVESTWPSGDSVFTDSEKRLLGVLFKKTYELREETVAEIEGLFSVEAIDFLRQKLGRQGPFLVRNVEGFLASALPNGKRFTEKEKSLLRSLLSKCTLVENPFYTLTSGLVRKAVGSISPKAVEFLKQKLQEQAPFSIMNLEGFLESNISPRRKFTEKDKKWLRKELLKKEYTAVDPFYYNLTEELITQVEGLFSLEAKKFLREKLDGQVRFLILDIEEFLVSRLPNRKLFTEKEKELLKAWLTVHTEPEKPFYDLSEDTVSKIHQLFSPEAKTFLQQELDENTPFVIWNLGNFLNSVLPNGKKFTDEEETLLKSLVLEHPQAEKPYYSLSKMAVNKNRESFSRVAIAFLQQQLGEQTYFLISDTDDFLESNLPNNQLFSDEEKALLKELMSKMYKLPEMPFASLIQYFDQLLIKQSPYPIGYNAENFLKGRAPDTCIRYINDELVPHITKLVK